LIYKLTVPQPVPDKLFWSVTVTTPIPEARSSPTRARLPSTPSLDANYEYTPLGSEDIDLK
jgi:hypothetical protein